MQVPPMASSFSRASGFEKRAMANTSLSGASIRRAGALTGPCPPTNSTFCPCTGAPRSEAEGEDRLVERRRVDRVGSREEPLVRKAGEETVDGALEVGDVALQSLVQAHVLEAHVVQALLLPRKVREVLGGDRRPAWVVGFPDLGPRGDPGFLAVREPGQRPDLH